MDVFLARQPIFDRRRRVYAYELLFRSGLQNAFTHDNPDEASAQVIDHSAMVMDLNAVSGGKKVFINATRDTLLSEHLSLLPTELAAVEVLETVEPDAEVIAACTKLKDAGYQLVLDDFVDAPRFQPLVDLADVIKVDFLKSDEGEQKRLAERFGRRGIRMLAEKVETNEAFHRAASQGYSYFQGYFFSKPEIVSAKDVPGAKLNYLRILKEIHRPQLDFLGTEGIIRHEMSMCYRLLRYINSAHFGLRDPVSSIMHAMTLLGEREFKKWASLVILAGMGQDVPEELVVQSMVRARFCEALGPTLHLGHRQQELFLMGMFSGIDTMLSRPLEDILQGLPIAAEIKAALLGEPSPLRQVFEYVQAYEAADWGALERLASELNLDEGPVPELYLEALAWAGETYKEVSAPNRAVGVR